MDVSTVLADAYSEVSEFVFLEPLRKLYYETEESEIYWNRYQIYFLSEYEDQDLTIDEKIELAKTNPKLNNYVDKNPYIISLYKDMATKIDGGMSYLEIRYTEDYDLLYRTATQNVPESLLLDFISYVKDSYDFFITTNDNRYYRGLNDYFMKYFDFMLKNSALMSAFSDYTNDPLSLETTNLSILNNTLDNYGFLYSNEIGTAYKQSLALSMFTLNSNKGSYDNMRLISNILEVEVSISSLYAVKYKGKAVFVKVKIPDDNDTELVFRNLLKDEDYFISNIIDFDTITNADNQWYLSEEDLISKLNKHSYFKTKYHYVDVKTDNITNNYLLTQLNIMCRWIDDDIKFNSGNIVDYSTRQLMAYHNALIQKVVDINVDMSSLISNDEAFGIFSLDTLEEIQTKAENVTSLTNLSTIIEESTTSCENYLEEARLLNNARNNPNINVPAKDPVSYDVLLADTIAYEELMEITTEYEMLKYYVTSMTYLSRLFKSIGINTNANSSIVIKLIDYYKAYKSKLIVESATNKFNVETPYEFVGNFGINGFEEWATDNHDLDLINELNVDFILTDTLNSCKPYAPVNNIGEDMFNKYFEETPEEVEYFEDPFSTDSSYKFGVRPCLSYSDTGLNIGSYTFFKDPQDNGNTFLNPINKGLLGGVFASHAEDNRTEYNLLYSTNDIVDLPSSRYVKELVAIFDGVVDQTKIY